MTVQCCKCKKVKRQSEWIFDQLVSGEQVSHSYCPACESDLRTEIFARQASAATVATVHAFSGQLDARLFGLPS